MSGGSRRRNTREVATTDEIINAHVPLNEDISVNESMGFFVTRRSRLTNPLCKLIIRPRGLLLTRSFPISPPHIYTTIGRWVPCFVHHLLLDYSRASRIDYAPYEFGSSTATRCSLQLTLPPSLRAIFQEILRKSINPEQLGCSMLRGEFQLYSSVTPRLLPRAGATLLS